MVDMLVQMVSTLMLVLGIAAGELIATKTFGVLKKKILYIVEIGIFVLIIVFIFNSIMLEQYNTIAVAAIYFASGFLTILFVRGMISGLGFFAVQIKEKVLKIYKQEDYVAGLKKSLERRGFEEDEIKRIAKEVGFKQNAIREVFIFGHAPRRVKPKKN
jgi:hypothetical protein